MTEALDTSVKTLLSQGVLGAFLILALIAIVFLYRACQSSQEARLNELTRILDSRSELARTLEANTAVIRQAIDTGTTRAKAIEDLARQVDSLLARGVRS